MDELKPCPFCGGKAELRHFAGINVTSYVRCMDCKAQTFEFRISTEQSSDEEAIEAWNRRVK